MHADLSGGQAASALFLGGGIVAGALVGWVIGPERGPSLLARVVSRVALVVLAATIASSLAPSGFLTLFARASLAAALGFLCGGLTQTLATAWSTKGARDPGGQRLVLALASLLCFLLWLLVLLAIPLLARF